MTKLPLLISTGYTLGFYPLRCKLGILEVFPLMSSSQGMVSFIIRTDPSTANHKTLSGRVIVMIPLRSTSCLFRCATICHGKESMFPLAWRKLEEPVKLFPAYSSLMYPTSFQELCPLGWYLKYLWFSATLHPDTIFLKVSLVGTTQQTADLNPKPLGDVLKAWEGSD